MKNLLKETIKRIVKEEFDRYMLLEGGGAGQRAEKAALKMMIDSGLSQDDAVEKMENIKNEFTVFKSDDGKPYLYGMIRMYINGELGSSNESIHDNEYKVSNYVTVILLKFQKQFNRDFNGLSFNELDNKISPIWNEIKKQIRELVNSKQYIKNENYQIVKINSFKEAQKYAKYTDFEDENGHWCITYKQDLWKDYTGNNINQVYFCLKNGFENLKPEKNDKAPYDEYGYSMISVIVNPDGYLKNCCSRWNHLHGHASDFLDEYGLSSLLGVNFFDVFKPNNKWKETIDNALHRLKNGENPEDIFDKCNDFHDGFASVKLNEKWNFINTNGEILSDIWFDFCDYFHENFAFVGLNGKNNYINTNGKLLSDIWFDFCDYFYNGFAEVELNEKYNLINTNGEILYGDINNTDTWFDECCNFENGFAEVELNGKGYNIDTNGQLYDENGNPVQV